MNKLIRRLAMAFVGISMAVGVGVAVGASNREVKSVYATNETTSTLTFTAACGGSGTSDGGEDWTITSDADESIYDSTKGIHYGTKNNNVRYIEATTSDFTLGTITEVVVYCSGANTPTLSCTVGGEALDTAKTGITTTNTGYTFSGSKAAGTIVVRLDKGSAQTKALYIKSIAVTYETATYVVDDLTLSTTSLSLDGAGSLSEVSGSFTYSVSYDGDAGAGRVTTAITKNSVATTDLTAFDNGSGTITLTSSVEGTYNVAVSTVDKNSSDSVVTKNVTVEVSNIYVAPNPVKVTNVANVSIGDTVYLVNETYECAAGVVSGDYLTAQDVELDDGTMTNVGNAIPLKVERQLVGENLYYTFSYNGSLVGSQAAKKLGYSNASRVSTWTMTISSGDVTITNSTASYGTILFNYNGGTNPRFLNYTSAQSAIQLYSIHGTDAQVALEFQNTYLKMNSYDVGGVHGSTGGNGSCTTYYPEAKAVYGTLTTSQKNALSEAALTRLHDWAVANGDNFNVETRAFAAHSNTTVQFNNNSDYSFTTLIVIISLVSLTAVGGYFVIRRRKENN